MPNLKTSPTQTLVSLYQEVLSKMNQVWILQGKSNLSCTGLGVTVIRQKNSLICQQIKYPNMLNPPEFL